MTMQAKNPIFCAPDAATAAQRIAAELAAIAA